MTKTSLIVSLCALTLSTPPGLLAGTYGGGSSDVHGVAERELVRRQESITHVRAMIEAGDKAMDERDYEEAVRQYRGAVDLCPESENTHKLRKEAVEKFCHASVTLAEQRIAEGRYKDAENLCNLVLQPQYAPGCEDAVKLLAHLEDPEYYNRTITPKHVANVEEVKRLMNEADGYYNTGRYDRAMTDYDKVLNIDPYNIAARKGQERVNQARDNYAQTAYNETRSRLNYQVDSAWQSPVRKFTGVNKGVVIEQQSDMRRTAAIEAKLANIIIPKIELRDATVREAVDFLKQKSVQLDTKEPDPARRGVNIVLKLEPSAGAVSAPAAAAPTEPAIPGLENTATPTAAPAAAGPIINPSDVRITLSLTGVPLGEVLKYIAGQANLKVKIDPYAVSIVPAAEPTDVLITKEYKVPPTFISSTSAAAAGGATGGLAAAGAPGDASRGGSGIGKRAPAREFLEQNGVAFPPGASAQYFASSSRLVVRNTQENLDLIDTLVEATITDVPKQVEIESKFVEITQNNLKELSFDWLLGQFNVPGSNRVFSSGGTAGDTAAINPNDFTFTPPGSQVPVGQNPITAANRTGQTAISSNAIDALLYGVTGVTSKAPAVLGIAGVFTDPQFQVVIRALNQKKGVDLLSAPRVTTKSGQRAVIEIIREFRYPTEFDPPQIPTNFGGGSSGLGASASINVFPVTPTTPTSFETRNTGVTLEVEPVVGPDGYTIDLNLIPQVVEFEGFINYGSPISTINPAALGVTGALTGASASVVLTDNVINQPIFSTRKVTTSVSIWDGSTVVLGGLMREDVQKVSDKTPLLGDIPMLGRLFRSDVDQHIKRNLVIFVTARLINPAGEAVRQVEEEDETAQELPLPEAAQPAVPTGLQK